MLNSSRSLSHVLLSKRKKMNDIALYLFSGVIIICGLLLLIVKNIMHGAYMLLLILLAIAGVFISLGAEFLAVSQLIVYVGGILVLLIFGIMLTTRISDGAVRTTNHQLLLGMVLGIGVFMLIAIWVTPLFEMDSPNEFEMFSIQEIGMSLLSEYLILFEAIGLLLLVVLVGAAFIAKKVERS